MSFEDIESLYRAIKGSRHTDLVDNMVLAAVRYARKRTDWFMASAEARQEMEDERTRAHNAFIDACNILSRNMAKSGEDITWRRNLGDDRKHIGDIACQLHCLLGIMAR